MSPVDFTPIGAPTTGGSSGISFTPLDGSAPTITPKSQSTMAQPDHGFIGNVIADVTKPVARLGLNLASAYDIATGNTKASDKMNTQGVNTGFYGNIKPVGVSGNFGTDLKDSLGTGLQIGSNIIPGEEASGVTEEGLKGLIPLLKSGAITGAKYGATNALGNSLVDNEGIGQTIENTIGGAAGGAIVGAPLEAISGKIAAPLFATAKQKAASILEKTKATQGLIGDTIRQLAKQYPSSIGSTLHEMETRYGTDPIGVVASYGKGQALPTLENGKLNVTEAQDFLKQKIGELSSLKTDAVKANNIGVPTQVFEKNVNSTISEQSWSQAKKDAVSSQVGTIIENIKNSYPKGYIPLTEMDTIKSEQAALSKAYNNKTGSPFELDGHGVIGNAAKKTVESSTGDAPTQELNKLIQSHYNAIDLLDKMSGKAPKGGMLTKQLNRLGGEAIGSVVGSAIGHPVIGALVGRVASDKISEILGNDLLSNPLKIQMIKNMPDVPNSVIKKMTDYLENQAGQKSLRLALPAPGQTSAPMIPKAPSEETQMAGRARTLFPQKIGD